MGRLSASPPAPDELLAQYRTAGLDYGPPAAALESIDELGRVRGMSMPLVAALRPHLSLFSPAMPNSVSADPIVAAAIAFSGQSTGATAQQAPAVVNDPNGLVTVRVHAM